MSKIKTAIIGATGYTGLRLLQILANHPEIEIKALSSEQEAGKLLSEVQAAFLNVSNLKLSSINDIKAKASELDLVFFATPNGICLKQASGFINAGVKVIDLSADYRFKDLELHHKFYGFDRSSAQDQDLNRSAHYGLVELSSMPDKSASLISCPGCYVTASILALAPLVNYQQSINKIFNLTQVIIDAKSGVSGAGKQTKLDYSFCEVNDSFRAYAVGGTHRHEPEIEAFFGSGFNCSFTPHLLPQNKGLFVTAYVPLKESTKFDLSGFRKYYADFYQDKQFVQVLGEGKLPATRNVVGTNNIHLQLNYHEKQHTVILCGALDNTIKGAGGQAVQNMNLWYGLPEATGLNLMPQLP
jgi:N-acetyl-gamma-glutamyl-phosphate reductase